MKQVWILNHYAQEPSGSGGTRHYHLAEYLKNYGWDASIIAASIDYQTGAQRLPVNQNQKLTIINKIPYLWLRTPDYQGNGSGRIRNMLSYSYRALLPSSTKLLVKPDIIIGSSVHPFAAWAGAILAKRHKVPFIFEVRDLWPQTLVDMGRLSEKSWITFTLRKLEKWLYKKSTKIIVLLPKAHEYITPLGISSDRIVWIPNGVDLRLFPEKPYKTDTRQLNFTLMYFGAHGQANGLDNLLQAMKIIQESDQDQNIKLRLIGDGQLKKGLIELSKKFGLKNTFFENPVAKTEIPNLASQADGFVFNLINAPVFNFGISSNKLFDFMASQRPIIFSCNTVNNPVEESQAGLTVEPENPQALAQAILKLSQMPFEERKQMGINGRKYVEQHHSFDQLAKRMADTLDQALSETNKR